MKTSIPSCTAICLATRDHDLSVEIFSRCESLCSFDKMLMITDRPVPVPHVIIDPFNSIDEFSEYAVRGIGKHFDTNHVLLFHWDGFIINPDAWSDEFLEYDYIGASWSYFDGRNVGNGGLSLRSRKLYDAIDQIKFDMHDGLTGRVLPEDQFLCRTGMRDILENQFGIRFAPDNVAQRFSFEHVVTPDTKSFGFHGFFNFPMLFGEEMTLRFLEKKGAEFCTQPLFLVAVARTANSGMIGLAVKMMQFAADHGKFARVKELLPGLPFQLA